MKISKLLIGLILITVFTGCVEGNNKMNYNVKNISDVTYKIDGSVLELNYSPLIESLYYSPGVTFNIISDQLVINITRCGINDECHVDVKAVLGQVNQVKIDLGHAISVNKIFINEIKESNNLSVLSESHK